MRVLFFILLLFVFTPATFAAESYICPMHPHIHGEAGDTCPICGMTLVPKSEAGAMAIPGDTGNTIPGNAIRINPVFVQALGVKTDEVSRHDFGRNIRAFGEIVPSTRNEYAVDMRTEGWIVDLATSAVGDTVKKGDLLFTYHSPDLMTAQSDYLIGGRIGNPEQRLRVYGMDEKAIAAVNKKGRFLEATPFHAPIDGTVVSLNVRKGSFVEEGDLALSMQDFSQVWVNADVPVRDIQFLSAGHPAHVLVPETGKIYESSVDFIHHVADPQSRTGTIRLVVRHEHGEPKPGTYVDVVVEADKQSRLAVPAEAVLHRARGATVIESLGKGLFQPVTVEIGITENGLTEIISGLEEGQQIVTSGQFMIDAESNLRGGTSSMGGMDMGEDMQDMEMEAGHEH